MNSDKIPACQDQAIDPGIFFPPIGEHELYDPGVKRLWLYQTVEALEVCAICPLQKQCFEMSIQNPADTYHGIRAGLTPVERIDMINWSVSNYDAIFITTMKRFYTDVRKIADKRGITKPHFQIGEEPRWLRKSNSLSQQRRSA